MAIIGRQLDRVGIRVIFERVRDRDPHGVVAFFVVRHSGPCIAELEQIAAVGCLRGAPVQIDTFATWPNIDLCQAVEPR